MCARKPQLSVLQNPRKFLIDEFPPFAQDYPAFQQQASNLIHDRSTPHHPALADPMQGLRSS
jgi:hypothetical protein